MRGRPSKYKYYSGLRHDLDSTHDGAMKACFPSGNSISTAYRYKRMFNKELEQMLLNAHSSPLNPPVVDCPHIEQNKAQEA